ncbi:hypothetical protein CDAR_582691 [Caerostris darwini]|uniref:Uncharacterized protein n=1 Tax=Caerostris darwini TaxID=1538125 RepID=A0AAV4PPR0_9ARAC|nr:hypothetical protein CDAR_582691 [Caerostris darwini]
MENISVLKWVHLEGKIHWNRVICCLSRVMTRRGKIPKELKKEQLCAGIKTGFSRFHLSCKSPEKQRFFSPFLFHYYYILLWSPPIIERFFFTLSLK